MKKNSRIARLGADHSCGHNRRGGMVILMTALILMIGILAGISVDVAWMQLVRTELRAATDATARSAAESLARTEDHTVALADAKTFAKKHTVGGQKFRLKNADIEFGRTEEQNDGTWAFTAGSTPYTAVRVSPKLDGSRNLNPASLFFANLLGVADFRPEETATAAHLYQDICLVVDRSHSMCFDTSGVSWSYPPGHSTEYLESPHDSLSRWAFLETAIENFIDVVRNQSAEPHVGLVTWANAWGVYNSSDIEVTMGNDYDGIVTAMTNRGNGEMPGGTNMAAGMNDGISVLTGNNARPLARKVMILMSDGQWNAGDDPETVAATAAASNIVIYTISFLDGVDQTTMINVANATGGAHYYATNETELIEAFEKIARSLPIVLTE